MACWLLSCTSSRFLLERGEKKVKITVKGGDKMVHADGRAEWMGEKAIFLDIEVHRIDRYQDSVHRGSTACQVTVGPRNCKVEIASRAAAVGPSQPSVQPIKTAWQSVGSLSCRGPRLHRQGYGQQPPG